MVRNKTQFRFFLYGNQLSQNHLLPVISNATAGLYQLFTYIRLRLGPLMTFRKVLKLAP